MNTGISRKNQRLGKKERIGKSFLEMFGDKKEN
jgi:hypothetical protein